MQQMWEKIKEYDNKSNEQEEVKGKNKKLAITVATIIVVVIAIIVCVAVFINNKKGSKNRDNIYNNEDSINSSEQNNQEGIGNSNIRFKNTEELKNFSNIATLSNGETMEVTGLDMVFSTAMKEKLSNVKTGNGMDVYTNILTSVGDGEIKSFIINENVIGGYVVFHHYQQSKSIYELSGYYRCDNEFAVKVINWEGLNKLRNIRF